MLFRKAVHRAVAAPSTWDTVSVFKPGYEIPITADPGVTDSDYDTVFLESASLFINYQESKNKIQQI